MSQPEKPKPVIRREEECRRLVTEYEASGMTMTEFSAERGLAGTLEREAQGVHIVRLAAGVLHTFHPAPPNTT